jgi:hypothetical protein
MNDKELLIPQICELDQTANPGFLGLRSEKDFQEYYPVLKERMSRTTSKESTNRSRSLLPIAYRGR